MSISTQSSISLSPYTTLFLSHPDQMRHDIRQPLVMIPLNPHHFNFSFGIRQLANVTEKFPVIFGEPSEIQIRKNITERSEEHTSELQSLTNLVCSLLIEIKKY